MRIVKVIDDTHLADAIDLLNLEVKFLNVKKFLKYDWGTERIQVPEVRDYIIDNMQGFSIDKTAVYHAHGIGNNCRYPLFFEEEDEYQQVGFLNTTNDMYGGMYIYLSDYKDNRVGELYKITKWGVKLA